MSILRAKLSLLTISALVVIIIFPAVSALAAEGDDFSVSDDYYVNQRRFGGTEMTAISDDYEIIGMLGEPGVGDSTSADYTFDHGTVWRTTGTLFLAIVDAAYDPVISPLVSMDAVTASFLPQTATGLLGTDSQRVYWENFDAADTTGYSITIAATDGATDKWDGPAATDYDFNDVDGDADGADADSFGGQLTVNPSVGGLTVRPSYGTLTGISLGVSTAFVEGVTDSITLVTASASSDDYHAAYATDMGLSQEIPGSQPPETYTINMTLTIA